MIADSLPKPGAKDGPELAAAAAQRFAEVKKDIRTVTGDLLRRFERAMVEQRRWSADEFRTHLAGPRLVGRIVRRLLWTVDGIAVRIAEDGTFADREDELVDLASGTVMVAHPVQLGSDVEVWAKVFSDHRILQPFPQLARETYRMTAEEADSARPARFEGAEVPIAALLGLERRGWRRGGDHPKRFLTVARRWRSSRCWRTRCTVGR